MTFHRKNWLGEILKKHRIDNNFSQEELAFNSGLDRTYISMLERGKRQPTLTTIFSISKALNVSPSLLIKEVETIYLK
ncbi:helix-turn-helix transcriptional regulator [Paenibacillus roseipurpureus]|uniref:Helix-turn-helix transcriptional regulator n=1 Tax=Paenibacillus roseopurpureus TaxID=2918901 RepID=A0AA96RMV7_9BACL|nr:helix-turn-helix transcriptional regulator [Paenibacillus sp. MBLB1832]WNR47075.1 helix-turn-helix transcriptional regulator [Paenibacillus sp. MBLB1832]